jgi:DNA-binding NtrC family response regulator
LAGQRTRIAQRHRSAAVILNGNELRAADLVIEESGSGDVTPVYQAPKHAAAKAATPAPANGHSVNLEELERQAILRALDQTGQHQERAAHLLGISSRTLSRKLKSYGLGRALSGSAASSTAPPGHRDKRKGNGVVHHAESSHRGNGCP